MTSLDSTPSSVSSSSAGDDGRAPAASDGAAGPGDRPSLPARTRGRDASSLGSVHRQDLHDGWTLTVTDGPVPFPVADLPASVPGTFLTDLLDAGLIADPYLDLHEHDVAWSGECALAYRTQFPWHPEAGEGDAAQGESDAGHEDDASRLRRVDLVADSLDTAATIVLNGERVARVENQHRSWRFPVQDLLREGTNTLEVLFEAPLAVARANAAAQGDLPFVGNALPYNAIRKMACNLGWDWGPVLVTSGIAGPIGLESWTQARLQSLRPQARVDGSTGRVRVEAQVELAAAGAADAAPDAAAAAVRTRLLSPEGSVVASAQTAVGAGSSGTAQGLQSVELDLEAAQAQLWWPRGYGEQPLYTVEVELLDPAGRVLDAAQHRVGFRTAGFVEREDEIGMSFTMVVNDQPILIKGANWIPDDCFPTRLSPETYRRSIGHALDAGMNMLRIWGGGLYESELLYDICDEEGILVWQDFAMACAAYSEEEPLRSEIIAEASEAIVRLAWHPSLVHWNGSNENVEGFYHWGWQEVIPEGTAWGNGYYTEVLPDLLARLDPTRSFTPSSPYSRPQVDQPRSPDHGTVHNWVVWASEEDNDYTHYRDTSPRFSAEFGFQAPANWATIERAISERPLDPDSAAMLSHQKAVRGQDKLRRGMAPHFPEPRSFEDFHLTTQLNQARALIVGIGHYRSLWPHCGGTIIWQLNDCWPVTSWAAVDGDDRRKLLWYAMRDLYAPVLLTIQPRSDGLVLALGNDTPEPLAGDLRLRRMSASGEVLAEAAVPVRADARSTALVPIPQDLATCGDAARELLVAELEPEAREAGPAPARAIHWFAEDKDQELDPDALQASARGDEEGIILQLEARSAVRDICIIADRVHPAAIADRQLISLLPGESTEVRIALPAEASAVPAEEFLAPGVLRHVNELVAREGA